MFLKIVSIVYYIVVDKLAKSDQVNAFQYLTVVEGYNIGRQHNDQAGIGLINIALTIHYKNERKVQVLYIVC